MSSAPKSTPVVLVVPFTRVAKLLLSKSQGATIGALISIGDPGQRRPSGFEKIATRLRLEFHDVLQDTEADTAPCQQDVERLIRFAQHHEHTSRTVLVHCEAGISRSTAAALILFAVWLGAGAEEDAVARVFEVVPEARPNATLVRLADELLQRNGALIAAVARRQHPTGGE